jgi:chromosome partitioning protein
MGILTLNALVAADGVLIPLQCEYYALEGLSYLLSSISRIRSTSNEKLKLFGVILTMFDKRSSLCLSVVNDVRLHLPNIVFDCVIPRNVKISEAPSYGKPVLVHDVKSSGARAYMTLAREFLARERSGIWNKN